MSKMKDWEKRLTRSCKLRKREQLERDLKAVNNEIEELEEEKEQCLHYKI